MVFIRLPGKDGRVKRLSGRFGGKDMERGRVWMDNCDEKLRMRQIRHGRQNLAPTFLPEPPLNGKKKPPPIVWACCDDRRIIFHFADGTKRVRRIRI